MKKLIKYRSEDYLATTGKLIDTGQIFISQYDEFLHDFLLTRQNC